MKRILFLVLLFVVATTLKAQYPVTQFLGSDSAMVKSRGGLQGRFAPIPFTDTTSANLSRISQYPGALIYTSGVDKYWYRNATVTGWIEFTSSGGSTVNIYNSDGTLTGARILRGGNNSLTFDELVGFDVTSTSGAIQFNFFKSDGKSSYFVLGDTIKINPNLGNLLIDTLNTTQDTSTYKPIVVDPVTGRVMQSSYWFGGSGGSSDSSLFWRKTGNGGTTASNFIGTTDLQPLRFKTNGWPAGFISARDTPSYLYGGDVRIGQFAGQYLKDTNILSVLAGHGAGANLKSSSGGQLVAIGNWSMHWTDGTIDVYGNRSVAVGQSTLYRNRKGSNNTVGGTFGLEANHYGINNTGWGRDVLRSNIDGVGNSGGGLFSLLNNTSGIETIAVTNGGSGYTTATVTVSNPVGLGSPGVYCEAATATATISGGVITEITVTNPGGGYSLNVDGPFQTGITVTITGDGSGATAEVTEITSGDNNAAWGIGSGMNNRYGKMNSYFGPYVMGRANDNNMTHIGGYGGVSAGAAASISNSTTIGYNTKVKKSNTIVLGTSGVSVAIGKDTAWSRLFPVTLDAGGNISTSGVVYDAGGYGNFIGINNDWRGYPNMGINLGYGLTSSSTGEIEFGAILGNVYIGVGNNTAPRNLVFQNYWDNKAIILRQTSERMRVAYTTGNILIGTESDTTDNGRDLQVKGTIHTADTVFAKTVSTSDSSDAVATTKWVKQQAYGSGSGGGSSDSSIFLVDTTYNRIASVYGTDTLVVKSLRVQYNGSTVTPTVTDSTISWNITGLSNPMTTTGDIIYSSDNSGTPARLGAGTSGYVLTSNGAGTAPSWQAAAGGGLTIGTTTVSSSNSRGILYDSSGTLKDRADVRVETNGNVNIGYYSDQGYKLGVNGTIVSTTMVTTGTGTFISGLFTSGGFSTSHSNSDNAGLYVRGGTTASTTTQSEIRIGGAATTGNRASFRGSANYTLLANNSYGGVIFGRELQTEASSGTHELYAKVAIRQDSVVNGTASTTHATSLYIQGPPTTNGSFGTSTSMWIESGDVLISNGILTATNGLKTGDPGSGVGTWKLGTAVTTSGLVLNTTTYVEVSIGGTVYRLAVVDPPQP